MSAPTQSPLELVRMYYDAIDRQDFDIVVQLFDSNARYERNGWPLKDGKPAIERFFREERQLRGTHSISLFVADQLPEPLTGRSDIPVGLTVMTEGMFVGTRQNEPIELSFLDFWVFDPESRRAVYRWSDTSIAGA